MVAGSGDNPCSLVGLRLQVGDVAVSLGTSDVLFGPIAHATPSANEGVVLVSPLDEAEYMARNAPLQEGSRIDRTRE